MVLWNMSGRVFFHANIIKAFNVGRFYTKDALFVWANLGKHSLVHLVMRLKYKDGHNTHYASRRTTFRSVSFKTYFEGKFFQTHNASLPFFTLETHNQTNY